MRFFMSLVLSRRPDAGKQVVKHHVASGLVIERARSEIGEFLLLFRGDVKVLLLQEGVGEIVDPEGVCLWSKLVPLALGRSLHATVRLRLAVSFRTLEEFWVSVQIAVDVSVFGGDARKREVNNRHIQTRRLHVQLDAAQSRLLLARARALDQHITPVQVTVLEFTFFLGDSQRNDNLE